MSKRTRFVISILMVLFLCVTVIGCASAEEEPAEEPMEEPTEEPAEEPEMIKVALVLPGTINDAGWNAAAYNGLMALEESGKAETGFAEQVPSAEIETALRDFAEKGYDIVIGHGFQFGDPVEAVASFYPDTYFFVVNGAVAGDNYASLRFANWETDYLIGMLAGSVTETNKLGAVGAFEQPSIVRPMGAFEAGAKAVNPDVEFYPTFIGSWSDTVKAKEAAIALANQGCDIIHVNCDAAAHGAYEGIKEQGVMAIGNTSDQNPLAPDTILTSSLRNVDVLLDLAITMVEEGTFEGQIYEFGLDKDAVGYAPFHGFDDIVPQDVKDLMETTRQEIIDGTLVVPIVDAFE